MTITPLEIIKRQFSEQRRGYEIDEVELFREEVREALEQALEEARRAREALRDKDDEIARLKAEQAEIKDTLVLARRLAEDLEGNARREADLVVGEARLEAQRIIGSSHDEQHDLTAHVARLKTQRARLEAELSATLNAHLRLLRELRGTPDDAAGGA